MTGLSPCQTHITFQRNILEHCCAQHVAYLRPPCCDMLQHVGSNLMLYSFGHVHTTLLR